MLYIGKMKKLLLLIILLFPACEKVEEEYCWMCTINFYDRIYTTDGQVWEKRYIDSLQKCGFTERDIQKFEHYRTVGKHPISVCGDHIRWQECYCIKQE